MKDKECKAYINTYKCNQNSCDGCQYRFEKEKIKSEIIGEVEKILASVTEEVMTQLKEGSKAAQTQTCGADGKEAWISVKDRLPNKDEYIENDGRFIATDGQRRYESLYDIYSKKFRVMKAPSLVSGAYLCDDKCIIAWQPFPKINWDMVLRLEAETEKEGKEEE